MLASITAMRRPMGIFFVFGTLSGVISSCKRCEGGPWVEGSIGSPFQDQHPCLEGKPDGWMAWRRRGVKTHGEPSCRADFPSGLNDIRLLSVKEDLYL